MIESNYGHGNNCVLKTGPISGCIVHEVFSSIVKVKVATLRGQVENAEIRKRKYGALLTHDCAIQNCRVWLRKTMTA